ncbi:helix-turn-helix domain-containing protein [Hyalangium rubrum]|uniref:MerR family transcriptional regulator n=1 Tax=Hyalangium rubrum TaxID=3103134 RepID=A0ABU5GZ23_9BACT|nr:MerR family transcriptional regulator [Hyalangium sp. s54d21]MDY7225792.1 MerR family transcriptional regulator [Hyalangium sp. s54d21]
MSPTKTQTEWKLAELAAAVGVSPRTVRYYVQRGLLSAPPFKGPDTVYGEEHLLRLKAIRVLQARFLPLDAIQGELERLSPEELRKLAEAALPPASLPPPPAAPEPIKTSQLSTPGPMPASRQTAVAGYRRWELAPGLELHLADSADEKTRALADRVRALIEQSEER